MLRHLKLLMVMVCLSGCNASSSSEPPPTEALFLDVVGNMIPAWSAGVENGIPSYSVVANVTAFGAVANDNRDDTDAFEAAISKAAGNGAVMIPEGVFRLTRAITLPSGTVLRGAGATTELLIYHSDDAFILMGSGSGNDQVIAETGYIPVSAGAIKGSMKIEIGQIAGSNPNAFHVGDGIELIQGFDATLHLTQSTWDVTWGKRLVGHFTKIVAIDGNLITLADPIRIDMNQTQGVWIAPVNYAEYSGFENFRVSRQSDNDGHIFNIKYASNVWLSGIHSDNANRCHVIAAQGRRLEIRNSNFANASDYGGGGHGYGVDLSSRQTGSLVVNNRFSHLRHSLVVHLGANGNVVAYNHSSDAYQDSGDNWQPDDLSLHGHYAFSNLFESNMLEGISISDYWGPTGPDNVFLRNSLQRDPVAAYDHANNQIFINNRFSDPGIELDTSIDPSSWSLVSNSHTLNGNPKDTAYLDQLPDSLFFNQAPDFYGQKTWPSLGADIEAKDEFVPAGESDI